MQVRINETSFKPPHPIEVVITTTKRLAVRNSRSGWAVG
jgi:hypothetical protein